MNKLILIRAALAVLIAMARVCQLTARSQQSGAGGPAPGAPGHDAHWESAGKEGVGTSTALESKVWFTLREGVLTEVYYPTVDVANVQMLQLIIVDGTEVETEAADTTHQIELLDTQALTFRQVNTAKSGNYKITKTYTTDPERHTVLIDIQFESRTACNVYVYYDPSLNNSGMHDSAWTEGDALLAMDGDKASALISSTGFADEDEAIRLLLNTQNGSQVKEMSNGYLGTSDGLTELKRNWNKSSFHPYARAADGNVVQVAGLRGFFGSREERAQKSGKLSQAKPRCTLALGFGKNAAEALTNARASLAKGFARARREYERGWHEYVNTLRPVDVKYQRQFEMAAMVLKAHEDKTYRGAMVASLTVPWGGGLNSNEPNTGGYHTVWARDLYEVATAFQATGDRRAATRALDYLFNVQQKPDGSFPQNSWLDGRAAGGGLQMDEVAYPLILAYQLNRVDRETWRKHVKPAADFILRHGPSTPQERWEEEAGYSPSTLAAEIAGLVCAAFIAQRNRDTATARDYLRTADEWASHLESWTATTNGPYGDHNYFLRISDDNDPNDGAPLEINSNGGTYDERLIVDAGFLELVRLGIRPAGDDLIAKSLGVVDRLIKVETPSGPAWYRYNHDAYGEREDGGDYDARRGRGRLWTLLSGERGEYELALGERASASKRLDAMLGFANAGLMIPEQVWDQSGSPRPDLRFGEGTGSATPLAWSLAQFIRLVVNLQAGRNLDTPDIVARRYLKPAINRARKSSINRARKSGINRARTPSLKQASGKR
ncbi:MAG TPA: glycoside hydrolase family 15 protein [Pyrinomonadaceae bacterium]